MYKGNWTYDVCKYFSARNGTITQCFSSDEELLNDIHKFLEPRFHEWVFTVLYVFVFLAGLSGNFLVCYAVWKNKALRTSTNLFLVNLAVGDFLLITLCLPPSYIQAIFESWFLGNTMCKVIEYYQTITIIVSVLTLTAISVERWFAICHPLTFKETRKRVVISLCVIWLLAHVIAIPRLIIFREKPDDIIPQNLTLLMTSCSPDKSIFSLNYDIFISVTFYLVPVTIMGYAYVSIAFVLWSSTKSGTNLTEGEQTAVKSQLRARRRTARMLIIVVVVFILCFLPMYTWNLVRLFEAPFVQKIPNQFLSIITLTAHWLVYFNSSVNPIIYHFMSAKFRKEFKAAVTCGYIICDGKGMRRKNSHELEPLSTTKGCRRYLGKDTSESCDISRSRTAYTEADTRKASELTNT